MRRRKFTESLFTHVGLLAFSVFALFPFVWMAITSVKAKSEIYTSPVTWIPKHPTFSHYVYLLKLNFGQNFLNSLFVAGVVMVIVVFLSTLAAYGFSRFRFRGRDVLYSSSLMGQLLPVSVMLLPLYMLFGSVHLLDSYTSLIIVYVAMLLPFSVWIATGNLKGIPRALDEAAMIDGCNRLQILFRVLVPPAMPGIISVALYAFIVAWQEFLFALVFINSVGKRTLPLGLMAFNGQYEIDWGSMMAGSLVTTLPLTILFVFLQRKLVAGLTGGAIK